MSALFGAKAMAFAIGMLFGRGASLLQPPDGFRHGQANPGLPRPSTPFSEGP